MSTTNAIGAANELIAAAWLINRGYEVFRNLAPIGPVDLIAVRDKEILKIDVKTATYRSRSDGVDRYYCQKLSDYQEDNDIKMLLVCEGQVIGYRDEFDWSDGRRKS